MKKVLHQSTHRLLMLVDTAAFQCRQQCVHASGCALRCSGVQHDQDLRIVLGPLARGDESFDHLANLGGGRFSLHEVMEIHRAAGGFQGAALMELRRDGDRIGGFVRGVEVEDGPVDQFVGRLVELSAGESIPPDDADGEQADSIHSLGDDAVQFLLDFPEGVFISF